jgi:hypothetical protein
MRWAAERGATIGVMKRLTIPAFLMLAVATGVSIYLVRQTQPLPFSRQDVVSIWLEPVPEGPISPSFVLRPNADERTLSLIEDAIPSPLPRNVWQGFTCDIGGDVVLKLNNGGLMRYGLCRRPDSIERLRTRILQALDR